ncbi:hypothetical protein GCK72_019711 [Caenorhabditis remanei]|uniref:Nose resistant-to-fluoxetine protein N-terminal domain-containing protein n=1 Tax=Caenorhabditis remanei TaxID=31234 RepID=A0A6A5GEN9_CAERE|nr:hypothetical protein GCK72_019711 [Caenorhabditis remanei]KAF1753155.1 hypothetical protein GCK72_019711 [Caenorhabditis remanei]
MNIFILFILAVILSKTSGQAWKDQFQKITGVSSQCANDTETWQNSLKLAEEVSVKCLIEKNCTKEEEKIIEDNFYAVEQYDAWGKIPLTAIFQAPLLMEGSYQECERINGQKYETNYCYMVLFPGKNATCHMSNGRPNSIYLRGAVCMPYSCSQEDLPTVYNQISNQPFTACAAFCSKYPVKKTAVFWEFTAFMAVMTAIVLISTLIDYLKDTLKKEDEVRKDGKLLQMAMAFSMWTNAELLLSVKEQKPGFIKCLDCIRLLSMLWVVTGHSFKYIVVPDQVLTILPFTTRFWNHFITNAFYAVDTFFLLSGIVVSYLFFKTRLKPSQVKRPVTWILFYVHRYLRLTPPLMFFIGFFVVYGYYIQGPEVASQLNRLLPKVDSCSVNWWKNMLYINNLGSGKDQCYGITWYLGVDTQLYLIAPVFLIGLYFSFAAGTALLVSAIVGSVITVYILFSVYDLPADFFGVGDVSHFYNVVYDKPWVRCTPYFIGLFIGYIIATYGRRKIRLNWALSVTGWLIAFGIAVMCLFSTYDYDKRIYWSVFIRASYYNFSRIAWAIAVSWVIVANHMGWGGPIDNFMSHPIWQPFGRLSYCAYIVHLMVLYWYFMYYSIPATVMSYIFAFFWSCFFEIPFLKLEKMLIEAVIGVGVRQTSGKVGDSPVQKRINSHEGTPEGGLWDVGNKDKLTIRV